MTPEPEWFSEATDLALGLAGTDAIRRMRFFNLEDHACSPEVMRYFAKTRNCFMRSDEPTVLSEPAAVKSLSILNRIACSTRREAVWRAFERFGTPPPQFVVDLGYEIWLAINDFDKLAITTKELKGASARIRTLALKLAEELGHPGMVGALDRARLKAARERLFVPRLRSFPNQNELIALADYAAVASRLPRVIGQPNSPGARRLYFIRRLTDWLYARLRTPMRSQVYELTGVFFDVSDLTPQMLATLAPVRKRDTG